ncbi:MAG TPA: NAD(+)/NADH kinase [Candidatus Fusicatenibacter merdavium]|uniref:NAD kinase n=1 Tax=Candidatus Fusicatenibacter merdavium TaxID=2838600 RepID=A0A9D1XCI8_9FIRM|nr:NAD(+)/NADH kinase [Candidatus Fusicatenibacter merdavium]
MERFYLIANQTKDKNFTVTRKVVNYLEEHGKQCFLSAQIRSCAEAEGGFLPQSGGKEEGFHYTDPSLIPDHIDCVIVLGGDGTLLQAARDVVDRQIPLLGINLGTLGYLADIDSSSIVPALDHLLAGEYELQRRMMLTGSIYRGNRKIAEDIALNDIVLGRQGGLRVVEFKNYVNGEFLNSYRADGIIIATPTGSTGYSLSAGGPVVSPEAAMLLMTPLAPHTLNTRSIIFPEHDVIIVELGPARDGGVEHGMAFFDGDTSVPMITGDRIEIKKSRKDTWLVKVSRISFLETLRRKMANNI